METDNEIKSDHPIHFFSRRKLRYLIVAAVVLIAVGSGVSSFMVFQPKLLINQEPFEQEDAVVFGSQNVSLLRFAATALYGDIELGAIALTSPDGKLPLFTDFRLWIDPEGDGSFAPSLYEDVPKWHLNYVSVEAPPADGFIIKKNETIIFEVRADSVAAAKEQFGNTAAIDFMAEPDFTYVTARAKDKSVGLLGIHTSRLEDGKTFTNGLCSDTCEIVIRKGAPTKVVFIPSICGNGHIEDKEQCDDGNIITGDGCSGECRNEVDVVRDINRTYDVNGGDVSVTVRTATKTHRVSRKDIDITAKRVFVTFDAGAEMTALSSSDLLNLKNVLSLTMSDDTVVSPSGYFLVSQDGSPVSPFIQFSQGADALDSDSIAVSSGDGTQFVIVFDTREQLFPVEITFQDGFTLVEDFASKPSSQSSEQPISPEESKKIIQDFIESKSASGNPGKAESRKIEGKLLNQ